MGKEKTVKKRDEGVNASIGSQIEEFAKEFSQIPVNVGRLEEGQCKNEVVYVNPPYFQNLSSHSKERTQKRFEEAEKNRNHAPEQVKKLLNELPDRVLVGKSTPDDIKSLLQQAISNDIIKTENGRHHTNSQDLQNWLKKYGIGVDCSGFVSQALNNVTQKVHETKSEKLPPQLDITNTSSSALKGEKGDNKLFLEVTRPSDLSPGDTMYIPGHVRIIGNVFITTEGFVQFTTDESQSTGNGGIAEKIWRYTSKESFTELQKQINNKGKIDWAASDKEKPVYGRYSEIDKSLESTEPSEEGKKQ